jgi:hypothetical protein
VSTESLSGSERRRSPRIPADHPVKLGAEMPADAECRCINISLGGVYCTLATKVALYTKMEVSIVSFAGAVVRLEEAPSGEKGYRAALVFQDMSDETEWVIGKYLLQNYRRWRG